MRRDRLSVLRLCTVLALGAVAAGGLAPARAQQSASWEISDRVINLGGRPQGGTTSGSASFSLTLESLGEPVVGAGLSSASYLLDASFAGTYPAPGEVRGVRFSDATTLGWDAERSAGTYNVYRDALSALTGGSYGTCWQQDIPSPSATDPDPVPAGTGRFYLVTAENRLAEEGTRGRDSAGASRTGTACP
ncbi:MAG: hypothetical protein Kow0062_00570 [Acidobacteriota bacterium]